MERYWCSLRKHEGNHRATLTGIEIIALAHRCCNEGAARGALKGKEHRFGRIKEASPGGGSV